MIRPLIDYGLLGQAITSYRHLGYKQIEVPWMVDRDICSSTFSGETFDVYDLTLVGSAEQGFVAINPHRGNT